MYYNLFTHSPTEGYFSHFQVLAIMNKVAVNIYAGFHVDTHFQSILVNTEECGYWTEWLRVPLELLQTASLSFKGAMSFCILTSNE